MMNEIIFVVEPDIEGGYSARALGHSIHTQADNMDGLKQNIRDAITCHFEKDEERPKVIRLHMVTEEVFSYA
jgi:hypothetical protein